MDEPARQVNLDFVLASASGLGFSFEIIRTSHTRITPSDDAEAKMLGVSQAWPSIFFLETTSPFTRVGWASSMQYATFPLVESQAVIFRSSPPVKRSPLCYISIILDISKVTVTFRILKMLPPS